MMVLQKDKKLLFNNDNKESLFNQEEIFQKAKQSILNISFWKDYPEFVLGVLSSVDYKY